mmetsp:Transcript_71509/g.155339  ORF Transcript_71509/g.155339 Transcript_71509/m.155339 type:complete len:112 (-) Transcript_71509:219-554(-)
MGSFWSKLVNFFRRAPAAGQPIQELAVDAQTTGETGRTLLQSSDPHAAMDTGKKLSGEVSSTRQAADAVEKMLTGKAACPSDEAEGQKDIGEKHGTEQSKDVPAAADQPVA